MKSYTNFIAVAFMEKVKNMHKYVGFFFRGNRKWFQFLEGCHRNPYPLNYFTIAALYLKSEF